tara:strand:+ start:654 stop:1019 length:366 start_codon:yes stop_codon:yes gene_type:complete
MTGAASNAVFATDLSVGMTASTVTVRSTSTVNVYNERSFSGSATTYPAHIQQITVNPPGFDDDITVEYVVTIPSTTLAIDTLDEIVLPAPISSSREIVKVNTYTDAIGQCGVTVYLGARQV